MMAGTRPRDVERADAATDAPADHDAAGADPSTGSLALALRVATQEVAGCLAEVGGWVGWVLHLGGDGWGGAGWLCRAAVPWGGPLGGPR